MADPLSAEVKQLIDRPNFAHLATLMPDGSPQSVPVWIGREGEPRHLHRRELAQGKEHAPRPAGCSVDRRLRQSLRRSSDSRPRCRAAPRSRPENLGPHLAQIHWQAFRDAQSRRTRCFDRRSRKSPLHQAAVRTHTAEIRKARLATVRVSSRASLPPLHQPL